MLDQDKTSEEKEKMRNEKIGELGQVTLENQETDTRIELLTIIGEVGMKILGLKIKLQSMSIFCRNWRE